MQSIFLAQGPAFDDLILPQPLLNVDVYNLIVNALGITGQPNNGTKK